MENRTTFLDVLVDGVLLAIFMAVSCFACALLSIIAVIIVKQFVTIPDLVMYLIKLPIYFVGVNAILAFTAYKMGYGTVRGSILGTLASTGIATVIYFPVCLLLGFHELISGIAGPLSSLIMIPLEKPLGDTAIFAEFLIAAVATLAMIPVYFALFAIFRRIGVKKRISERLALERERSNNNEN